MILFELHAVRDRTKKEGHSSLFIGNIGMLIILAMIPLEMWGQVSRTYSILEALSTYRQDSVLNQIQHTQNWAGQYSWKRSPLRQMELRTETDEFDLRQQEFTFRLSPRTRKEIQYRRDRDLLRTQTLQSSRIQRQALVLEGKYHLIQQVYFTQRELQQKRELLRLGKEKIRLLALEFNELKLDPIDLAKAETDLFDLESNIDQLTLLLQEQQDILVFWFHGTDSVIISFEDLISIPAIRHVLLQASHLTSEHIPEIQFAAQKVEERYIEWQLDQSRNRRWIDFFQARVRGDELGLVETDFSIGIGLTLPLIRDNRTQNAVNELQWRLAQNTLEELISAHESDEQDARKHLLAMIDKWELLSKRIEEGVTKKTLTLLRLQEDQEALVLVQLEEQLKLQTLILMEIEQRIYETYLQWLNANGLFSMESPRNYFSQSLELLD